MLLFLVLGPTFIRSYPSGAPICSTTDLRFRGMDDRPRSQQTGGWFLSSNSSSFGSGSALRITLSGPQPLRGFTLQSTSGSVGGPAVGRFLTDTGSKYSCGTPSFLTHSSVGEQSRRSFIWTDISDSQTDVVFSAMAYDGSFYLPRAILIRRESGLTIDEATPSPLIRLAASVSPRDSPNSAGSYVSSPLPSNIASLRSSPVESTRLTDTDPNSSTRLAEADPEHSSSTRLNSSSRLTEADPEQPSSTRLTNADPQHPTAAACIASKCETGTVCQPATGYCFGSFCPHYSCVPVGATPPVSSPFHSAPLPSPSRPPLRVSSSASVELSSSVLPSKAEPGSKTWWHGKDDTSVSDPIGNAQIGTLGPAEGTGAPVRQTEAAGLDLCRQLSSCDDYMNARPMSVMYGVRRIGSGSGLVITGVEYDCMWCNGTCRSAEGVIFPAWSQCSEGSSGGDCVAQLVVAYHHVCQGLDDLTNGSLVNADFIRAQNLSLAQAQDYCQFRTQASAANRLTAPTINLVFLVAMFFKLWLNCA
eukprot:gb/GEZN01004154.1/.p1 GENE.gb/GEZN01004154.1/~~gb/GEZN01004154.1/.p1  ORF type:complete len:531 (+),score=25.28 gb/GEZN01004154.1/:125-1717(+)